MHSAAGGTLGSTVWHRVRLGPQTRHPFPGDTLGFPGDTLGAASKPGRMCP